MRVRFRRRRVAAFAAALGSRILCAAGLPGVIAGVTGAAVTELKRRAIALAGQREHRSAEWGRNRPLPAQLVSTL
jgi:hypothetical protein